MRKLRGRSVKRPKGTLSGHAAGLPFEDLVNQQLRDSFPGRTYRHFELLNHLFRNSPKLTTSESRDSLLGPPSLQGLLRRGRKATNEWTNKKQFSEKQNDTAETIILPTRKLEIRSNSGKPLILIDVKTQNNDKRSQPPNIISADKVANFCRAALEFEDRLAFRIFYVAIKWQASKSRLTCCDTRVVSLTRIAPASLYINWAAARQIQFHPFDAPQTYRRDELEWAHDFLSVYCNQLEKRISKDRKKLKTFRSVI